MEDMEGDIHLKKKKKTRAKGAGTLGCVSIFEGELTMEDAAVLTTASYYSSLPPAQFLSPAHLTPLSCLTSRSLHFHWTQSCPQPL